MLEKTINGFSVVAYATQPEGRTPARAFLETRRLPPKVKPGEAVEQEDLCQPAFSQRDRSDVGRAQRVGPCEKRG
jgi:hypothetical protein